MGSDVPEGDLERRTLSRVPNVWWGETGARAPAAAATVVVGSTSYMYSDGAYYARVVSGGAVAYQVVPAPAGAIIATLPASCTSVRVGAVAYTQCGPTYYQRRERVQVVVLH